MKPTGWLRWTQPICCFDRITRLAARHFDVPISLISLIASDRQWFKSVQGLDASETSREISFCGHAILRTKPLVIRDTLIDSTFSDNPLVTGNPRIRFYAGCPVLFRDMPIGTLCLIDRKPRAFSEADIDSLTTLAHSVEAELQLASSNEAEREFLETTNYQSRVSMIDPVTQTWNTDGLSILLSREIELAARTHREYALMAIEFKIPEDMFAQLDGAAGDMLVRKIAQDVRSALRPHDMFARTTLSKLVVFCPDCDADSSELLMDRVCERVMHSPYEMDGQEIAVTLWGGIASASGPLSEEELSSVAYQALTDAINEDVRFRRYLV